jgi:hypothetical protein
LIKVEGLILALSGALILINHYGKGGVLLIIGTLFMMITKDNPMLETSKKLNTMEKE